MDEPLASRHILGVRVHATTYERAVATIVGWALARRSAYVCCANVHMVMEAQDDPAYRDAVNAADLVTSDGMPLVWVLRWLGVPTSVRVYGPTLMTRLCAVAARTDVPIGLYGSTTECIARLRAALERRFPGLRVAYAHAPPFRPPSSFEMALVARDVDRSGARLLFVGLGCPKQERWMAEQRGRIAAPMVGVGCAFDFHAGLLRQAPPWVQRAGLEWLFRLAMEPRRLWRRYARHNPRFIARIARALLRERLCALGAAPTEGRGGETS